MKEIDWSKLENTSTACKDRKTKQVHWFNHNLQLHHFVIGIGLNFKGKVTIRSAICNGRWHKNPQSCFSQGDFINWLWEQFHRVLYNLWDIAHKNQRTRDLWNWFLLPCGVLSHFMLSHTEQSEMTFVLGILKFIYKSEWGESNILLGESKSHIWLHMVNFFFLF